MSAFALIRRDSKGRACPLCPIFQTSKRTTSIKKAHTSLGSRDKPIQNADGTTDLYIGPKAPEGKEANWLPIAPGRGFFAILRLYGPSEGAIEYSCKPGDFEKVNRGCGRT